MLNHLPVNIYFLDIQSMLLIKLYLTHKWKNMLESRNGYTSWTNLSFASEYNELTLMLEPLLRAGKLALTCLPMRVENRPGRVEFCIGYIRDYPVRTSTKEILVSQPVLYSVMWTTCPYQLIRVCAMNHGMGSPSCSQSASESFSLIVNCNTCISIHVPLYLCYHKIR